MVRTRIAPSPTGNDIHIGNLYTAMINYVVAKKNKGQFIIRIEDTDRTRLVPGAEAKILSSLKDYGILADEPPLRQSDRLPLYKEHALRLVETGAAYYCTCSRERLEEMRKERLKQKLIPKYDKHCLTRQKEIKAEVEKGMAYVIRLNVPSDQEIRFMDLIRGEITINTNDLDDQILLKSDGFPTYHLAVVVDDHLMTISHVIRAEEWLPSTPKHVLLYQAFGWSLPVFAHLPILRNPDHSKLSKRKNPVWSSWYLEKGYLPEAVLNYLALMGWSHPQGKELFTFEEFIQVFDLKDVQTTGPVFDPVKLAWLNGEYIRQLSPEKLETHLQNYLHVYQQLNLDKDIVRRTIPLVSTRMKTLSDYWPLVNFIFKQPEKIEFSLNTIQDVREQLLKKLSQIDWKHDTLYKEVEQLAQKNSLKPIKLFMDLRYALSNQKVTAPLFESMEIIGRDQILKRLKSVLV